MEADGILKACTMKLVSEERQDDRHEEGLQVFGNVA